MIEMILDYLTMQFQWVYRFRLNWCKRRHGWIKKTLVDGEVWERNECLKCGFWEDFG